MIEDEGGASDGEGTPAWMATFGDLMSLLLTFFVLLLSFANMDVVKFREMLGSVQDAFGVQHDHPGDKVGKTTSAVELSQRESTAFLDVLDLPSRSAGQGAEASEELAARIEDVTRDRGLDAQVEVDATARGVVLRVKGQVMFEAGSVELRPSALPILDQIADVARLFSHPLSIEGHTDDLPVASERFPSNWHLSSGRAIAALRYLVDEARLDPKRLACTGYADMRPLVPNDTPGHRAMNRRIEFVFQLEHDVPFRASF